MRKQLIGFAYVSIWVVIWGTIGSLIDYPLLQSNIYLPGSIGQITTFALTACFSIVLAVLIFPTLNSKLNE